jgi:hypothetical protein
MMHDNDRFQMNRTFDDGLSALDEALDWFAHTAAKRRVAQRARAQSAGHSEQLRAAPKSFTPHK